MSRRLIDTTDDDLINGIVKALNGDALILAPEKVKSLPGLEKTWVADALKIHRDKVYKMIKSGELKTHKDGKITSESFFKALLAA